MAKKIREKSKIIDKSQGKIFYKTGENPEYILKRKVFCVTTRNVYIIAKLLCYVIFESVSISNYKLTHIIFIHRILCRQDDCSNSNFSFSFFCIHKEATLSSKNMCFIENRCGMSIILAILIIICIIKC